MSTRAYLIIAFFLAAAAGAVAVEETISAFSSSASNPGNSFSAASSFGCPGGTPSTVYMTGLEHGRTSAASPTGIGIFNGGTNGTGSSGPDTAVVRNGAYSMRLNPQSGSQAFRSRGGIAFTNGPVLVSRLALRFETLPAADVTMLAGSYPTVTGSSLRLGYKASTQKFTLAFGDGLSVNTSTLVESSSTVSAGTWYVVEWKHDMSANPHTAVWRIDDVAQPSTSVALAPGNVTMAIWGSDMTVNNYTAYYDDLMYSQTGSDYPLGDGKILALSPNGSGTHNNPGSILQDDTSTAIGATTWNRLDEVPINTLTDYVKQTGDSGTAYGEFTFADTTETCISAVRGLVTYDPLDSNQANNGKFSVFDGTSESVAYSGDMTEQSTSAFTDAGMVTPASSPWTQSALNGLKARIGYSTDASPQPRWQALMLEYNVPQ